jgi:cytochrome c-type biogenesis protein CcmF
MVGAVIVWIAFVASVVSAGSFYWTARRDARFLTLARNSYGIMTLSVVAASALLLVYILTHRFEYAYVWEYSSRSLQLDLLITTFWAGQDGSFMLWALCGSLIGLGLMAYSRRKAIEPETMALFAFIEGFLLLLLILKSPFKYIWDAYPNDVPLGTIPSDGRGLNPLLQNFWMIAHPPMLFAGFAAMAVPFVFAVGALWRKSYQEWIPSALPWVIAGAIALGTGIMLGGYWAYGVLGWGGWWGWDPVENSSLVPWIIAIILVHTMLIQRRTGGLVRMNFFLGVSTFVLVVYSTFLTRSGILGSASVHSFVNPGGWVYAALILWIASLLILGLVMLMLRWKELKAFAVRSPFFTRESFLGIASAVMGASALVVLFGTSYLLFPVATLERTFYDNTNLPLAIGMMVLLGLSLGLQWKEESGAILLKNSVLSLGLAVVGTGILIAIGLHDILMGLLAFASLFAFFVNAMRMVALAKESIRYTGGTISHIGLALLFLGIIGSGRYGEKQTASLPINVPTEVLGHQLTYTGSKQLQDGKWTFSVKVAGAGSEFTLEPVMYQSDYNNSLMRNPDYASSLTRDFYVEPVSLEEVTSPAGGASSGNTLQLKKGETQQIGDAIVTFLRFDTSHKGTEAAMAAGSFPVGAVIQVKRGAKTEEVIPVTVYHGAEKPEIRKVTTKDGALGFELIAMNVGTQAIPSTIELAISGASVPAAPVVRSQLLVIEASVKPFMSVLWAGAVFVLFGLIVSLTSKLNGSGQRQSL